MARRTILILTAVVVAVAVATAAVASSGASKKGAVVKTRSTELGTILTNSKGATLYMFEKDTRGKSACSGACAQNWPPLTTKGKPRAKGKAVASKLGRTNRGYSKQVTYNGHPLYTFVGDGGKPGATTGEELEAFGGEWYVVGTNGRKIEDED